MKFFNELKRGNVFMGALAYLLFSWLMPQIVRNTLTRASFESICADPWNHPNLLKDEQFIAEVQADGRFAEFLKAFVSLSS